MFQWIKAEREMKWNEKKKECDQEIHGEIRLALDPEYSHKVASS